MVVPSTVFSSTLTLDVGSAALNTRVGEGGETARKAARVCVGRTELETV